MEREDNMPSAMAQQTYAKTGKLSMLYAYGNFYLLKIITL